MKSLSAKVAGLPLFAWLGVAALIAAALFIRSRRSAAAVPTADVMSGMPQATFYSGQGTQGGLPTPVQPPPPPSPSPVGGGSGAADKAPPPPTPGPGPSNEPGPPRPGPPVEHGGPVTTSPTSAGRTVTL